MKTRVKRRTRTRTRCKNKKYRYKRRSMRRNIKGGWGMPLGGKLKEDQNGGWGQAVPM